MFEKGTKLKMYNLQSVIVFFKDNFAVKVTEVFFFCNNIPHISVINRAFFFGDIT